MIYPYLNKTEVLKTDNANGYLLAETTNNAIVELHINEMGIIPAHTLPMDVTFYVVSGRGELTLAEKTINATKGDVIEVKRNMDRMWSNPFSAPLLLLVIKQIV